MNAEAEAIIKKLGLVPLAHEGGWFRPRGRRRKQSARVGQLARRIFLVGLIGLRQMVGK
jgi:predicted cupin superfamily sugar epimerase